MKAAFSVRDIMRILKCCDQVVLDDIKRGNLTGHKVPGGIRGRYDAWAFSFSETANYINAKRRKKRNHP